MVVVVVYFLKKRNLIVLSVKKPESPTVSFENPFYTVRDQTNVTQVNINHSTLNIAGNLRICKSLTSSLLDYNL